MFKAKVMEWGGVEIDTTEADQWIERGIRFLERNSDAESSYTTSGNRAVFVFRENGLGEHCYEVFDCIVKRSDALYVNEEGFIVNKFKRDGV